ncbi:hypothetical protein [Chitinophaga rhizophila]|uniref:Uncharacterized protein n=1 Tax=Chitinophaga rhizophila TaxID=2866212 RepID=A0ABS7GMR9_9BACT|nr:hypothetical protein [Chitinophaga rhizophila]MBW8688187.1 hypothetical protein [Chitinophaga rhizophila]
MRTPLLPLQQLLESLQHPPRPDDPAVYEIASFMHRQSLTAIEDITIAFDECLAAGVSEATIRKYVRICQEKITTLCNDVPFSWLEVETAAPVQYDEWRYLCNDICHQLEDLIIYLMFTYAKYYNKMAIAPNVYRELMRQRINPGLSVIRNWFNEKDEGCRELQQMLLNLYDAFDPQLPNRMNYYQLDFLRELQQALLKHWAQEDNSLDHGTLQQLLFTLNFNSTDYYHYCTSYISQQLMELPDVHTQLDLLSFIHKTLSQLPVKPGLAYSYDSPSIISLLKEWLLVETKYLQTRRKGNTGRHAKKLNSLPENFKLQTSLTLPELAALFRVLKEAGVVENRNMQDVFRLISLCFSIQKKEAFEGSLFQSYYYHIAPETYKKMEDLAHNIVRKTFQLRKE